MISAVPSLTGHTISRADVNEVGNMYIISLENGKFLKVTESVKLIIEEIDGVKNYAEISESLNQKYGANISAADLEKLITVELGSKGLIQGIEADPKAFSNSRLWFHFRLFDGKAFKKIAEKLTFLFQWPIALTFLLLLAFVLFYSLGNPDFLLRRKADSTSPPVVLVFLLLSYIIHEFGHIVACYHYGVKPRGVGVGIYLIMPVFYTDLSEVWVLNKRQRSVTGLGGVYFQSIFLVLLFPLTFISDPLFGASDYKILIQLNLLNIFFNFNPLLRMDGYWILSDLIGTVNIHQRSRNFLFNFFRKIFHSKKYVADSSYELTPAAKKIFYIWSFGYILITLLVIVIGVVRVIPLFKNGGRKGQVEILILILFIVFQAVIPTLRNLRRKRKKDIT